MLRNKDSLSPDAEKEREEIRETIRRAMANYIRANNSPDQETSPKHHGAIIIFQAILDLIDGKNSALNS